MHFFFELGHKFFHVLFFRNKRYRLLAETLSTIEKFLVNTSPWKISTFKACNIYIINH